MSRQRAGKAGAVKVDKNDGTFTDKEETGLPADGWATIAAGVAIAGRPPIVPEEMDIAGEDEVLAHSAAIAGCTYRAIKATISRDREAPEDEPARAETAESPTSVDWGTEVATEADDWSNNDWELLLVEHEVMIKENAPIRGAATEPKEDPTRQKTTVTTAPKSNVSKMIDFCESAVKSLGPC